MAVTPTDIAVELGRATPNGSDVEFSQWEQWIADALYLIGKRLTIADLDLGDVDYVVRQAVAAHVRRPDDATQVAVSVDDGSVSKTYRTSRGRLEIIDDWWALLSPPTANGRAFSVHPTYSGTAHTDWCSLSLGANYCSCGVDIAGYPIFGAPE